MGKTKEGQGTQCMAVAGLAGVPLAGHTASDPPHDVPLVREILAATFTTALHAWLIGDKADASDPLDVEVV